MRGGFLLWLRSCCSHGGFVVDCSPLPSGWKLVYPCSASSSRRILFFLKMFVLDVFFWILFSALAFLVLFSRRLDTSCIDCGMS